MSQYLKTESFMVIFYEGILQCEIMVINVTFELFLELNNC